MAGTCSRPGCDEPKHIFPSQTVSVCLKHLRERSREHKKRVGKEYWANAARKSRATPEGREASRKSALEFWYRHHDTLLDAQRSRSRKLVPDPDRPGKLVAVGTLATRRNRQRPEVREATREAARRARATPEGRERLLAATRRHNQRTGHRGNLAYQARKLGAFVEAVDKTVVWERDGGRCYLAGPRCLGVVPLHPLSGWHLEHVIPLSRGGQHSYANAGVACPPCNLAKGAKTPDEFLALEQGLVQAA
jgi:5-methylcytosine-specific restriction endonuclease McrA